MEFLKTFEEAKKLGITKEEFLPVWELELKSKQTDEHSRTVSQSVDISRNQSEINDYQISGAKFSSQWQQVKDELQQDLQLKLQYFFNELVEKQELQWKLLCQKYDQLQDELRCHFQTLNNHISNISDAHASSIKLFLMQEITLLEKDLKKAIETESAEDLFVPYLTPSTNQATFKACHDPNGWSNYLGEKNTASYSGAKIIDVPQNVPDNTKPRSGKQNKVQLLPNPAQQLPKSAQQLPKPAQQLPKPAQQLPKPVFDIFVNKPEKKLTSKDLKCTDQTTNRQQHEAALKSTTSSKVSAELKNKNKMYARTSENNKPLNINTTKSSTPVPSNESPIKGTGVYIEAISNQVKDASLINSAKSSSLFKEKEGDNSLNKKEENKANTLKNAPTMKDNSKTGNIVSGEQRVIKPIPSECATFTIDDSLTFSKSEYYMTPFYYTKSKVCKVRFRLYFSTDCKLNIFFLVSNGQFDNTVKWPISFTGNGFIYNASSQGYSPIWTLGPLKCSKPEPDTEIIFKTVVILKTHRSTIPDVTYQTICNKGFAIDNQLSFEWDLNAVENSGK